MRKGRGENILHLLMIFHILVMCGFGPENLRNRLLSFHCKIQNRMVVVETIGFAFLVCNINFFYYICIILERR